MVSDKTIHKAFRTHTATCSSKKPIREIFQFHYLPKLYIGFLNNLSMVSFMDVWYMYQLDLKYLMCLLELAHGRHFHVITHVCSLS